jgi:hypothetical protein
VNLVEEDIPASLLPIFSLYSAKIIEYSQFAYAPSVDLKDFNPLIENGIYESI